MYNIAHLQILQGLFIVLNFVYGRQCAIQKKVQVYSYLNIIYVSQYLKWVAFDVNNIFNTYFDTDWCLPSNRCPVPFNPPNVFVFFHRKHVVFGEVFSGMDLSLDTWGVGSGINGRTGDLKGSYLEFSPPKSNMTMENPPFEDVLMSC